MKNIAQDLQSSATSMTSLETYRRMTLQTKGQMALHLGLSDPAYYRLERGTCKTAKLVDKMIKMMVGDMDGLKNSPSLRAAYVRNEIDEYRKDNPLARWCDVYKNVPNMYGSVESMKANYNGYKKRCGL